MKLIEDLELIHEPFEKAVITLGNFDGVHKGHLALLNTTIEKAHEIHGTSVAITFEPHPIRVLDNGSHPPLITIYEQKLELLERTGIDVLLSIPFTREFADMEPNDFIEDLLVKRLGMKAIVVGNDYSFGKKRQGNIDLLRAYGDKLGFEIIIPQWITAPDGDDRISSTRIRDMIKSGDVKTVPELLGRHYQLRGKVVSGRDRGGKLLGFPTANINLRDELSPETGVYAVTVKCRFGLFKGVANIGYSPTFDDHLFTVEVHILDFNHDIYNQDIRVNLIEKLRDEKKFSGISELSEQIRKDIEKARLILEPFA
ncbi:MAG: bifunctional riboflavin kinase/FAD synthetase [Proteobacteria bacterium]|nr:bifunctional riboflavin kinase/FAD synthetase [Pseudomonadota bacterium]